MQFFLYEIAARIVAVYLGFDCGRKLLSGLRERKVESHNSDFLDWWSARVIHRDAAPVRYWIQVGILSFGFLGCLVVAIFGWWRPNA